MKCRFCRWSYSFFSAVGGCLILIAAYAYFAPPPDPALLVAQADMEVSHIYPGQKREVVYRLENGSRHPLRIVGLEGC